MDFMAVEVTIVKHPIAAEALTHLRDDILDVDLLAFERGSAASRKAVVEGVRRSLETGFVYTSHD
ncbi:MAG: hypothetical protein ACKOEH_07200, partial [Actinomycetota bacterium]